MSTPAPSTRHRLISAYLWGLGLPGAIILLFARGGAGLNIWNEGFDGPENLEAAHKGATLGFLVSLLFGGEVMGMLLTGDETRTVRIMRVLGYATVWISYLVFWSAFDGIH